MFLTELALLTVLWKTLLPFKILVSAVLNSEICLGSYFFAVGKSLSFMVDIKAPFICPLKFSGHIIAERTSREEKEHFIYYMSVHITTLTVLVVLYLFLYLQVLLVIPSLLAFQVDPAFGRKARNYIFYQL